MAKWNISGTPCRSRLHLHLNCFFSNPPWWCILKKCDCPIHYGQELKGKKTEFLCLILSTETPSAVFHCTCGGDVRAATHLQKLQGVTVVGHQHLQWWIIHWSVINLQWGQWFGVDKHHSQSWDEMWLWKNNNKIRWLWRIRYADNHAYFCSKSEYLYHWQDKKLCFCFFWCKHVQTFNLQSQESHFMMTWFK